ncbi:MAG TPA: GtrA family protein [Abditibacteriaceae bacterium]|jgi:putative flippase GtrA
MNDSLPATSSPSLLQNVALRQFVKFCIVGVSNLALDLGVSYILTFHFLMWWPAAKTLSFLIAVTNSFFWNSRWTFRAVDKARQKQQYALFVLINVVGWMLNLTIMKSVFWALTRSWDMTHPTKPMWLLASFIATAIVVSWNFFANRHWTFKQPAAP